MRRAVWGLLWVLLMVSPAAASNYCDVAFQAVSGQISPQLCSGCTVTIRYHTGGTVAGSTTTDQYGNWCVALSSSDFYDVTVGGVTRTNIYIPTSDLPGGGGIAGANFVLTSSDAGLPNGYVATAGDGITLDSNTPGTLTIASTLGTTVDLTSEVEGALPVANGGTGASSFTSGECIRYNGTTFDSITCGGGGAGVVVTVPGDAASTLATLDLQGLTQSLGAVAWTAGSQTLTVDASASWPLCAAFDHDPAACGAGTVCVDTDATGACVCGSGTGTSIENEGTSIVTAATLNFSGNFDVAEDPAGTAAIDIRPGSIVLGSDTTSVLPVTQGGTGQTSWDASTCVQVNASGDGLESTGGPCNTLPNFPQTECISLDVTSGVAVGTPCVRSNVQGTTFDYQICEFPDGADKAISWAFNLPDNLSGTGATAQVFWTGDEAACNNSASADVCWNVDSGSVADNGTWKNGSLNGTIVGLSDTCQGSGTLNISAAGSLAHGWTAGQRAMVRLSRATSSANCTANSDDYTGDAQLLSLRICYEVDNIFSGE